MGGSGRGGELFSLVTSQFVCGSEVTRIVSYMAQVFV